MRGSYNVQVNMSDGIVWYLETDFGCKSTIYKKSPGSAEASCLRLY